MNANVTTSQSTAWSALSLEELGQELAELDEPRYRAEQMYRALHVEAVVDWDQITTLSRTLRAALENRRPLRSLTVLSERSSRLDGSTKLLFAAADGGLIEGVLMVSQSKHGRRLTACLSSQIGCPAGCTFCASGLGGLVRNLTVAEIVDQVMYLARLPAAAESKITNVVFMGMGEPFLNYARVMRSIEQLRSSDGFGLGARRITVSTVGIVPNIERFAREPGEVNLAVSLHAPNDEVRSRLVPYNSRYPVAAIIDATREYAETTKRRVSFEYVLLEGSNDAPHLADELGKLLRPFGALAHVNLIPWNPFPEGGFVRATREQAEAFALRARRAGVNTTIRYSKGLDIDAACGQLRRRQELGLAS